MALYTLVNEDQLNGAIKATADAIREKTGSEDPIAWDKETGLADSVPAVYEAGETAGVEVGRQAEYDAFWDAYQQEGDRYNWNNAFFGHGWDDTTYNPKYPFSKVGYVSTMFSQNMITDTLRPLDLTQLAGAIGSLFQSSTKMKTIRRLTVLGTQTFINTFQNCFDLVNIEFSGEIGNNIDFGDSSKLSKISITNIIDTLADSSSEKTVTLSLTAVNNAFETSAGAADGSTSEEWTTLIATKSNWTIALADA